MLLLLRTVRPGQERTNESTWKEVEKQIERTNTKSETRKVIPFSELLAQYEIEVDKIEAQYREAIAQGRCTNK